MRVIVRYTFWIIYRWLAGCTWQKITYIKLALYLEMAASGARFHVGCMLKVTIIPMILSNLWHLVCLVWEKDTWQGSARGSNQKAAAGLLLWKAIAAEILNSHFPFCNFSILELYCLCLFSINHITLRSCLLIRGGKKWIEGTKVLNLG